MSARFRVREYIKGERDTYDLFLAANGYELRSRFVVDKLQPHANIRIASGFDSDQIFHYQENAIWFGTQGYELWHYSDESFVRSLEDIVLRLQSDTSPETPIRIGIDISSETRFRLASILRTIYDHMLQHSVVVDFFYAVADFTNAPAIAGTNTHVGPVLPSFAGWWSEPERPLAAAVGLGYEENKALGAAEHIQVSTVYTFTPLSPVEAYSPALEQANATLLRQISPDHRFVYDVSRPFDTFVALESFAFGVTRKYNLILLPFGPKIFALCAFLLGLMRPELAVWRVSGGENRIDRKAFGDIFGLTVEFSPKEDLSL